MFGSNASEKSDGAACPQVAVSRTAWCPDTTALESKASTREKVNPLAGTSGDINTLRPHIVDADGADTTAPTDLSRTAGLADSARSTRPATLPTPDPSCW
jgi:hypothetical protein